MKNEIILQCKNQYGYTIKQLKIEKSIVIFYIFFSKDIYLLRIPIKN